MIAIRWTQEAWKEIGEDAIKIVLRTVEFLKITFDGSSGRGIERNWGTCTRGELRYLAAEYVSFDADILTSEALINAYEINWWQKAQKDCIKPILNQNNIYEETQEISKDDNKEEHYAREENLSFAPSLTMLDKINDFCFFL